MFLTHLECSRCSRQFDAHRLHTTCPDDGKPLFARYDWNRIAAVLSQETLETRLPTMWRYRELLPVHDEANIVTLGEGFTPLLRCDRLGQTLGMQSLWIKDESQIPTGSFKARGLSMAVSRAKELGVTSVALPTAGNAGGALAAYAARAGMDAHIFAPCDVPVANRIEAQVMGANVTLVDGLITDCGRLVREGAATHGWFDMSTLKEPYRVEGKKTMGLELAEQFHWNLPDVILYPTGGGTGLIGMWKAFEELETLGWIGSQRPRMVSVQAEGCAPIVRAFHRGAEEATPWQNARTVAAGLRVPSAVADFLMLRVLRESGGTAVAVSDEELLEGVSLCAEREGIFACPEGGATVAALRHLLENGTIEPDEHVVLFNTGSGLKYLEVFE